MEKSGYKNEEDKPSPPKEGKLSRELGCDDFKNEAMDISYGQAGKGGCSKDSGKIKGQMKQYGWTD